MTTLYKHFIITRHSQIHTHTYNRDAHNLSPLQYYTRFQSNFLYYSRVSSHQGTPIHAQYSTQIG